MKRFLAVLLFLLPFGLCAEPQSKQAMIDELVEVMQMESIVEATYDQMEGMMQGLSAQMGVKPEEQQIFDLYYKKMTRVLKEEMSWQKMSPLMVDIYQKHFSENEIREMLAFYKTETGQSIITKLPLVSQEAMLASQRMVQSAMPKIQAVSQELAQELQRSRQQD